MHNRVKRLEEANLFRSWPMNGTARRKRLVYETRKPDYLEEKVLNTWRLCDAIMAVMRNPALREETSSTRRENENRKYRSAKYSMRVE